MEVLVYGHKSPDTDSVCSAIAYSALKRELGMNAIPYRLGELNEETKFILNYFGVNVPELLTNVSGKNVILVDHNERSQTADGFEDAKVLELIDHHRIANFNVNEPLKVRAETYGCTSTIILDLYEENNTIPEKIIASLMLSAILSDTLIFKSPTCTPKDIEAAKKLAKIAEIDINSYGVEMLKAGTALDAKSEEELLKMDLKTFEVNGKKIAVGQVNSVNEDETLLRKEKLISEIEKFKIGEKLDLVLFVVTNILTSNSKAIVIGEMKNNIEEAFGSKIENNVINLVGVVSRKKQIIPPIMKIME